MMAQFETDNKFEARLDEFLNTFNPKFQEVSRRLLEPAQISNSESNFIHFYTGLFAKTVISTVAQNENIAYEIAFQLELVYLMHNLRLNFPWSTFGKITKRPSSIASNKELTVFGNDLQARLHQRMLSDMGGQLPATVALNINQVMNKLALELSGKRNQILSGRVDDIYPLPVYEILDASLDIADIFEKTAVVSKLRNLIGILTDLRYGSTLRRVIKLLSTVDGDKFDVTKEELIQLGLASLLLQSSNDSARLRNMINGVETFDITYLLTDSGLSVTLDKIIAEQSDRTRNWLADLDDKNFMDLSLMIEHS